jgi:hypothetical protein
VGDWERGEALARRSIEIQPVGRGGERWWYWPIGKAAWRRGDYAAALAAFVSAYDARSWLSEAQLAYTLVPMGRLDETRAAVERLPP